MGLFDKLFENANEPAPKTKGRNNEEARRKLLRQVEATSVDIKTRLNLKQEDVEKALWNARLENQTENEKERNRRKLRLQLGQYWYLQTMNEQLDYIVDEVQEVEMVSEFNDAVRSAVDLVENYNVNSKDVLKSVQRFIKAAAPLHKENREKLNEMAERILAAGSRISEDEIEKVKDDHLDAIINNEREWLSGPLTKADKVLREKKDSGDDPSGLSDEERKIIAELTGGN